MKPIKLEPNRLGRNYRGGRTLAEFRNIADGGDDAPEDWIASMTAVFDSHRLGPSRLPGGRLLREATVANRDAFFSKEHLRRFGSDSALLVKLLDAGERLPVHCHPNREFARKYFESRLGKTEGWVILSTTGEDPAVYLGFEREVDRATLAGWIERQDREALLAALNRVPVRAGDTFFVPGGLPHAVGEGVFMVELQEPTDFTVLLEWEGYEADGAAGWHLGLREHALEAVDTSAWTPERLEGLRRERPGAREARPGVSVLFPPEADAFFRAERIQPNPTAPLPAEFSVLVVVLGFGELQFPDGTVVPISRGDTVLVPYSAGECQLAGLLDVVRCLPPDPAA